MGLQPRLSPILFYSGEIKPCLMLHNALLRRLCWGGEWGWREGSSSSMTFICTPTPWHDITSHLTLNQYVLSSLWCYTGGFTTTIFANFILSLWYTHTQSHAWMQAYTHTHILTEKRRRSSCCHGNWEADEMDTVHPLNLLYCNSPTHINNVQPLALHPFWVERQSYKKAKSFPVLK